MQRASRVWQQAGRVANRHPSVACSCIKQDSRRACSHKKANTNQQQSRAGNQWLGMAAACIMAGYGPAGLLALHPASADEQVLNTPACLTQQLQEGRQLQWVRPGGSQNPLAMLAGLFNRDERDPIDPFTLYGTTTKKFVIEQLDGEKIVSRKRGFTVETCVANETSAQEQPDLAFRPTRDKVATSDNKVCKQATGSELQGTCLSSCEQACTAGLDVWAASNTERTGFQLLPEDRARLLRGCTRECTQDCSRPGKAYDFAIPYRK